VTSPLPLITLQYYYKVTNEGSLHPKCKKPADFLLNTVVRMYMVNNE
jgi:hypothetical protein